MSDCLFCRFVRKEIPVTRVYEDDDVLAFPDIAPQAPIHYLLVPKMHVSTLNELTDATLIGKLTLAATQLAKKQGVAEDGYRLVMNCNSDAGQSVYHVHMHLLAGRHMTWPPG